MFSKYHGPNRIGPNLVRRARRSDDAFEDLLKIADRLIIAFALRSGVRGESIDDLLQDGRIVAWNCVQNFDPKAGAKFTTFLGTSLKNRFNQHHYSQYTYKRKVRSSSVSLDDMREDKPQMINGISDHKSDDQFNLKNTEIFLSELMDILPEEGRKVCQLMMKGLTQEQIAKKMHLTKAKVRSIFDRKVRDRIIDAQQNNFL